MNPSLSLLSSFPLWNWCVSGCVTSAESVLIEMQNHKEVYKALASKEEVGSTAGSVVLRDSAHAAAHPVLPPFSWAPRSPSVSRSSRMPPLRRDTP